MSYQDLPETAPEAGSTVAHADINSLPPGFIGPATGNAITGNGTITGHAGADIVADPPGHIVAVEGAGGAASASNGEFVVQGQYGVLTIEADGDYTYVRNAGAPDGVQDVFNYTLGDNVGHQSSTTLTIELGVEPPAEAATAALEGVPGVIDLPAGVELSDIHVVGRDLVIDLPDGTHMTIPGGAVFVPQLVIGDVEVPPTNLAALLIDSEPKPAAGPPQSSGGNFATDVPPLDPGVPLGDLVPPTELAFQPPEFREVNGFINHIPTVIIETPDNPVGAVNASESVYEKGLPERGGEPAGSGEIADGNGLNNSDGSETNTGTIVYTAEDGLESVTINGVAITGVGQVINGQYGTITITSIADGAIGYSYTLLDNTSGDNTADNFSVVVTDRDGDTATGTLTVHIVDDVPTAHNDTDAITGLDTSTDGNVMTGAGTTSGASGADVVGADNATVTGVHAGTSGSFTAVPQDDSSVLIHGTYGDLTIYEDGSYTYTRTDAHTGGTDVFTYQLTDGDGDTSTATLTIDVPQVNQAPTAEGSSVNVSEEGLVGGNPDASGSPDTTNSATASGSISASDADGDALTITLSAPAGSYTSGGQAVNWSVSADGHTLIGYTGSDSTTNHVVEITIANDGTYHVDLIQPFDDPNPAVEDSIKFDVPVHVSDGHGGSSDVSISVTVEDDSPTVSGVEAGAGVSIDETTAGSLGGYPISSTSASAVVTATTVSVGADTPGTTAYGLTINGDGTTSLATSIGDHPITLVQIDADTIEGQYTDGTGTHTAFSLDIGSDGKLTVTLDVPLEHLDATNPNDTLDLSGLVNATITVTDYDGDTASGSAAIGGNIVFYDDGPSIDVVAGSDANVTLTTHDALTIGSASDSAQSTANFGGVFSIGSYSGGGDGAASTPTLAYALGTVDGTNSGLTQQGNTIYLYQLGDGSVVGSTSSTEAGVTAGNEVFSVTVNGSGQVTLTQFSEIDHPLPGSTSNFNSQTVSLADGAITLTASSTITDNDGDTATDSQTVNIGANLNFADAGPTVSGVEAGAGVSIDETTAGSLGGYPISSTSASAVVTATTVSVGADTPGTTAYGLTINGDGTTSLATSIGDHPITLVQIDADTIEGQYTDGTGTHTAFSLDIGSDGKLTVTLDVPLEHLDATNPNDTLDLSGLVNATITVTDYDGDTASGSAAIGGNIVFYDDGPSIDVVAGSDANVTLTTHDALTIGSASDSAQSTANFGGVFSIGSYSGGGDGAASTPTLAYALGTVDGTDSGLTQQGNTIYLYQLGDGSVVGSTSSTEAGVTAGNEVFSVTVNGSGQVTLTQFSEIDHPLPGSTSNFNSQTVSLADGAITLTASSTITDNDGDTATDSQTVNIGANLNFADAGPTVSGVEAGAGVSIDETTAGSLGGYPISSTSASAVVTATTVSVGADTPGTTAYGLTINGDGTTSLATSIGDHPITLVQIDADTIEGQYTDGTGTHTAFSLDIGSDGKLTVTLDVPLEHLDATNPNDTLDLSGLVNATITVTDYDGDTASGSAAIGGNIVFYDDGPSIDVVAGSDANVTLTTHDALTIGSASDSAQSTANFGGVFSIGSYSGGGDGAASTPTLAYALGTVDGTDSGLTQQGNTIYLYQLGDGSVVGSTSSTEAGVTAGNEVFSVTVNGSGQVTLTQFSEIDHPLPGSTSNFDLQTVSLADGAITLTASSTITDNDGDTATDSQTVNIGANLNFADAGPTVSGVEAGAGVSIDETTAGSLGGYPISSTSASAVVTATTVSVGADTPGTTAYGLTINGDGTTSLATSIGDHPITLVQIDADTIEGQYTDGTGTHTAFSLDIGSDGKLTVTLDVPLEHLDATNPNDTLDLSGLVNATITVTDYDGDTASGSAAIGGNIVFYDDGPSIDVVAGSDANVTLTTHDALTIGSASDSAQSTANFGGVFSIGSYSGGGDGAASTPTLAYALGTVDGTDSGLTQQGNTIYLYQLGDGSVVGSTSSTEAGVTAGNEVFSVTVNGSGQVTLTQFSEIDHPLPGSTSNFDSQTVSLADGAITLTASSTITDNDGDTATDSQTVNIGANLNFADAGPTVSGVEAGAGVSIDETTAGSLGGYPISSTSASAVVTATTVSVGADTPGTTAYGLTINGDGTTSLATSIGDHPITLVQIDADTIEGQYTDGTGTHTAFSLDIGSDGKLTVTLDVPLEHLDATNPNDTLDLSGLVNATITVTDYDGDTASGSAAIGGNIVFYDDGPSIDVVAGSDANVTLTTHDALTIGSASDSAQSTANFGGVFSIGSYSGGGDGAASTPTLAYALGTVDGTDSGLTQQGNTIYLYQLGDGSVVGSTSSTEAGVTAGNEVFSVTVNGSGQVTLTQFSEIDHPLPGSTSNFDSQTVSLADGAITLTASSTITDNDGDTATDSQTVNIGANLNFADAGPTVSGVEAGAGVSIDETTAGSLGGYPISSTSASAVVTATTVSVGADTPGTTAYGLTINGDGTTSLATSIGDHPITLVQIDADTIEGQYTDGTGTHTAFSLDIGSDGKLTVTLDVPLEHLDATNPNDTLDLSGLVNATITVTDYDGDTASGSAAIGGNIVFYDDGPSIDVVAGSDANVTLTTHDALTIGSASDSAQSTANFGGVFSIGSYSGGGDGAASTPTLAYALGTVDGTDSGLTQQGNTIYLYQLGDGSVVGSTSSTEAGVTAGNEVFSVTVNGSGQVTLTQFSEIDHPLPGSTSNFDLQTVSLADGAITLTASSTITDNDGDTATDSQTVNIGANLNFADAGPTVSGVEAGAGVSIDETTAGSLGGYPISSTSASAVVTATTVSVGADTPGTTAYGLTINGDGTTSLATSIGDHPITLVQIDADTIEGQYTDGTGTHTAFSLDIGSDGKLTVTLDVPLEHLDATNPNDTLDLSGLVNATITVTDYDGDTASGSAAIGGNIVFYDDGPSIDVVAGSDANVTLTTHDALTIGSASDSAQSTANFGGVFSIGSYSGGGDGAASTPTLAYALGTVDGTDSGLTQQGNTIYLYQLGDGSVVGSTSSTEAGVTAGNEVFSVTVNGSGQVTLTQFSEIDHPLPGSTSNFDSQTVSLADGAITLTASSTITDNDGDTATDSQTVNIGANLNFADAGPTAQLSGNGAGTVTLDETRPEGSDTSGAGAPSGDASATLDLSAAFVTGSSVNYGADGAGSVSYALQLTGTNVASGLYALDNTDTSTVDGDGYGQGGQIVLNQSGNTVTGSYNGTDYFTITINPSTGVVTFAQLNNIWHPDAGSTAAAFDDTATLTTALASALQVTQTVTDYDGDSSSASVDLGQGVFAIQDDGPSAIVPDSIVTTDEAQGPIYAYLDADHTVVENFGTDGPGTITFANITNGSDSGLTSNGQEIDYWLSSDGQTLSGRVGSTDGTDGTVVFTVHIDQSTSQYDFTQYDIVDNGSGVEFNNLTSTKAGNTDIYGIGANSTGSPDVDALLSSTHNGANSTVNTDATSIGVQNQSFNPGDSLRIDFVTALATDAANTTIGFDYGTHVETNLYEQTIPQVVGNPSAVSFKVWALETSDSDTNYPDSNPTGGFDNSSTVFITQVSITGHNIGEVKETFDISSLADGDTQVLDYGMSVTRNADGSVTFSGVEQGDKYEIGTGSNTFNAVDVQDVTGKFDVGVFALGTTNYGSPVHLSYDLQITDADGDHLALPGAINIELDPTGSQNTATTLSTLSVEHTQVTTSTLLAANTNTVTTDTQKGVDQSYSNNALVFGAVAAAGLMANQAAASDRSHGQAHDGSTIHQSPLAMPVTDHLAPTSNDDSGMQSTSGETGQAVSDVQQPQSNSHGSQDVQSLSVTGSDHAPAGGAPTALPLSTDAPSHGDSAPAQIVAAAAVATPSAGQVAALAPTNNGVAGDVHTGADAAEHNAVVGKVLADFSPAARDMGRSLKRCSTICRITAATPLWKLSQVTARPVCRVGTRAD